mgnify:CR=1 FL=1
MRYRVWGCVVGLSLGCGDDTTNATGTEGSGDDSSTSGSATSSATSTATTMATSGATGDTTQGPSTDTTAAETTGETDPDTGVATSTGTSTGSDSGTTGDSDSDGDSGTTTGSGVADCYAPVDHPYDGALCGTAANPCTIELDEVVHGVGSFRNDAPGITHDDDCAPQVLYSVAQGGYFGYLAARTGPNAWDVANVPDPMATGNLVWDTTTGTTQVLVDDGAFGLHLSTYDGVGFVGGVDPGGMHNLRGTGVEGLGYGTLVVGAETSFADSTYLAYDGAWGSTVIQGQSTAVAAGVALDDAPHLAFWSSFNGTWQLFWGYPDNADVEGVLPLGSNSLQVSTLSLEVVGLGEGTPYIVAARQQPVSFLHEVVLAHRTAVPSWQVDVVASEDPAMNDTCDFPPLVAGEQCAYDYVRYRPLDVVASQGGDVRVLYAEDHFMGDLQAECMPAPVPFCAWVPLADASTFSTWIAAYDGAGFEHTLVLDDRRITSLDTSLDANGDIHVAAYVEGAGGSTVQYVRLGG